MSLSFRPNLKLDCCQLLARTVPFHLDSPMTSHVKMFFLVSAVDSAVGKLYPIQLKCAVYSISQVSEMICSDTTDWCGQRCCNNVKTHREQCSSRFLPLFFRVDLPRVTSQITWTLGNSLKLHNPLLTSFLQTLREICLMG